MAIVVKGKGETTRKVFTEGGEQIGKINPHLLNKGEWTAWLIGDPIGKHFTKYEDAVAWVEAEHQDLAKMVWYTDLRGIE
jgi:hypothetical protein